ncbi:MAG: Fe-S-cluster containining protein [Hyphomicrobiaceae bacterium]|jgi:Fe-S-cluster containining protein
MSESESNTELRFECTECGKCCRVRGPYAHVYMNEDEVAGLAKSLGLSKQQFRWRYTTLDELGWTELVFKDDRCVFLDDATDRCTVYEARPTQCRTFPFWRNFVRDGQWTPDVAEMCEGIGQGPVKDPAQVETLMRTQEIADDEGDD